MTFDSSRYGAEVQSILALDGDGNRAMPLTGGSCSREVREALSKADPKKLFPSAASPAAAMSGLLLYFSCHDEAHNLAQSISTADGSFWHAILHRQEPDPANAAYWFRQVGRHPIYPVLHGEAARLESTHAGAGFRLRGEWDPFQFIDFCEQARRKPGSPDEQLAQQIQLAEWQILFDYCARPRS